jgi:arylsulfatase A-like enzyme
MASIIPPNVVPGLPRGAAFSVGSCLLVAIALGLCGGYLDVVFIVLEKHWQHQERHFRAARDFAWTVPLAHAALSAAAAIVVAALCRLFRRSIPARSTLWLLAALALWAPMLRLPMYGWCTLLLAAGLSRVASGFLAERLANPRVRWLTVAALSGMLAVPAALTSGRQALAERRAVADLPAAPTGAPNVVLVVWDTVRAYNASAYGYRRHTTPYLALWSNRGVMYAYATAPAPWTYPSHTSFLTGRWPFELNSQWKYTLDTSHPTLAEYLSSIGYQTAGFAANTNCCSYESGLNRGFIHYDDYLLTPVFLLARTVPGKWILQHTLGLTDYFSRKWIGLESRGAGDLNDSFLGWLGKRRPDRPFFAFLNYFDAHEPYVPPATYEGYFGIRPQNWRDREYLWNFIGENKTEEHKREILMARDGYDDCIAYLDEQLNRLLERLSASRLLDNTVVIITSDHGEGFGDHGTIGHSYGVFLEEIGVPLVILGPKVPVHQLVRTPVSLRDLPATIVDLIGQSSGSPFPGRSLAELWREPRGQPDPQNARAALSEQAEPTAVESHKARLPGNAPFQLSLVADGHHYIRNGNGAERLFDLTVDPFEMQDLLALETGKVRVTEFRRLMLDALEQSKGSPEVEEAYLMQYRNWLKSLVEEAPPQKLAGAR